MILFATDLDNTLIHSYKRADIDDICVERANDGKKLSYMTQEACRLLENLRENNHICIVPLTTRSIEQYQRINLFSGSVPEYAVTSNGGNLLVNGVPDRQWLDESLELTAYCVAELKKSMEILDSDSDVQFPARFVDDLFVFTKSDNPEKTVSVLENMLDTDKVSVFSNGAKVYVLPDKLSKGNAVRRLCRRFDFDMTISAGDSRFDISMLSHTDISFYPSEEFAQQVISDKRKIIRKDNSNYAEFICRHIADICGEFYHETV